MSHVLKVEPRGGYLDATVTGDNTLQDVEEYLSELRDACFAQGCRRVLIEENLQGPSLSTMAIYDIVVRGSEKAPQSLERIAYLDVNPDHAVQDMEFAATVAVNRSLNVRLFTDRGEAEEWLSR